MEVTMEKVLKNLVFKAPEVRADYLLAELRTCIAESESFRRASHSRIAELEQALSSAADSTLHNAKRIAELKEVAESLREWIDALPSDTRIDVEMPGIDRDYVDSVLK